MTNKNLVIVNSIKYNQTERHIAQLFLSYIRNIVPEAKILDCEAQNIKTIDEYFDFNTSFSDQILANITDYSHIVMCCSLSSISRVLPAIPRIKKNYTNTNIYLTGPNLKALRSFPEFEFSQLLFSLNELTHLFAKLNIIDEFIDEENADKFILNNINIKRWDMVNEYGDNRIPLVVSKGCKYRCSFCDYRQCFDEAYKSIDLNVISEIISQNVKNTRYRHFNFLDASLTSYPQVTQLCNILESHTPSFKWRCFGRVNEVDHNIAYALKKGGCDDIFLGIESGCNSSLANCNKSSVSTDITLKATEVLKENELHVSGSFILGIPNETEKDAIQTIEYSQQLNLDCYYWHIFHPTLETISNLDFDHPYRQLLRKQLRYPTDIPDHFWDKMVEIDNIFLLHRHAAAHIEDKSILKQFHWFNLFSYPVYEYIHEATEAEKRRRNKG